jgi:pSer/pThr/pTyr-binding forkhead associated (FHA) protein
MNQRIRLRGINGTTKDKTWEADRLLRIGRLATLEVVIDDVSISRQHAEVRRAADGWRVRDLGSRNGTFVNGTQLAGADQLLRPNDLLQIARIALRVEFPDGDTAEEAVQPDVIVFGKAAPV